MSLVSTIPIHPLGALHLVTGRVFLSLFGRHTDLCLATYLVGFLGGIYGSSLTSQVAWLHKWFEH